MLRTAFSVECGVIMNANICSSALTAFPCDANIYLLTTSITAALSGRPNCQLRLPRNVPAPKHFIPSEVANFLILRLVVVYGQKLRLLDISAQMLEDEIGTTGMLHCGLADNQ